MGIFKTIFNELFGSKKTYEVKDLGIFTSKVCDWWLDKEYSWGTAVRLPPYSKDTFVLVEGDASAPPPQQLADLRKLLQDWESIITRLDNMLPRESRLAHKDEIYASWHDTFYPEGITPSLEDGGGWEIGFVRTDDLKDHFYFIWNRNTVQDLTLGVGA